MRCFLALTESGCDRARDPCPSDTAGRWAVRKDHIPAARKLRRSCHLAPPFLALQSVTPATVFRQPPPTLLAMLARRSVTSCPRRFGARKMQPRRQRKGHHRTGGRSDGTVDLGERITGGDIAAGAAPCRKGQARLATRLRAASRRGPSARSVLPALPAMKPCLPGIDRQITLGLRKARRMRT
jgi:hypothetical protein